jgi:hypothetical protein
MTGTARSLPDRRIAPARRRVDPNSAEAAAAVVESYYALLEQGRTLEAAKLRRDGPVVDLKAFRELHAQVGAPGRIEGAAGSLFVVVPIVLYGLTHEGEVFRNRGKVTLRRVNGVPGATPEQLSWRIEQIEVSPPQPVRPIVL